MQTSDQSGEVVQELSGSLQARREWQQFLETAVHDLNAPLRGISTSATMLSGRYGEPPNEDTRQLMQMLQEGVVKMSGLLKALGDYAVALNIDDSSFVPIPADAVLRSALAAMATRIQDTGAVVEYSSLPRVVGNWDDLSMLFRHLIANAIQYSSESPAQVTVSADRDGDLWRFAVRDNGAGIDARYHELIFEPFQRLHGSDQPGAGLGLSICRKIVDTHGGKIWIESKAGEGSTFFFTLPAAG